MDKIIVDKGNYDKFIFKGILALEFYGEMNDNYKEEISIFNKKIKEYRSISNPDNCDKERIVNEIIDLMEKIGPDNFIFYEDGGVEYNVR